MKFPNLFDIQSAIDSLERGAGMIPQWARGAAIARLCKVRGARFRKVWGIEFPN
jgi:hypothetical protein